MTGPAETVYVGLGSNLDDPQSQVTQALLELGRLPHTRLDAQSSLYVSAPLGPQDQPEYINAVARLQTTLMPLALLDELQAIEQTHRRVRQQRWGPRTLDLDILLFGDRVIDLPRLQVPHPHMHSRVFVLRPLAEIEAAIVLPGSGDVGRLLQECDDLNLRQLPG